RGVMVLSQRYHNVSVPRADGSRVAVGEIHAAVGQSDVINDADHFLGRELLTNGILNSIAKVRRFLNAGSGGRPQVQGELTAVNLGEKVLANPGNQQKRSCGCT